MPPFGQILYLWRRQRGLTQDELARRARIPRPNLCAIERGRRDISLGTLRTLALALDVAPGVLADGLPPGGSTQTPLSRQGLERIAKAVALGRPLEKAQEREVADALRHLVRSRLAALRQRSGKLRRGVRAAQAAWLTLEARYGSAAVQSLIQRVLEKASRP